MIQSKLQHYFTKLDPIYQSQDQARRETIRLSFRASDRGSHSPNAQENWSAVTEAGINSEWEADTPREQIEL
jgi:hypothetical protein